MVGYCILFGFCQLTYLNLFGTVGSAREDKMCNADSVAQTSISFASRRGESKRNINKSDIVRRCRADNQSNTHILSYQFVAVENVNRTEAGKQMPQIRSLLSSLFKKQAEM